MGEFDDKKQEGNCTEMQLLLKNRMSVREIAAFLGVPKTTAHKHLHKEIKEAMPEVKEDALQELAVHRKVTSCVSFLPGHNIPEK